MFEIYSKLRDEKGISDYQVAKATGINRSTFSDWKSGRSEPKHEKLQKIADYFGVSLEYLTTGTESKKESTSGKAYYFNDETAEVAQELFENKEMRLLFDAAKGSRPEDLKMAEEFLRRLKDTNPEG